jgi:hypothetical protein
VAAALERKGQHVELKSGGLGELRVSVDGRDAYVASRLWYPRPRKVLAAVERLIGTTP